MSKRDRDLDMGLLRQRFTPEELLGSLAFAAGLLDRPEPCSARELTGVFSWDRVPREDLAYSPGNCSESSSSSQ